MKPVLRVEGLRVEFSAHPAPVQAVRGISFSLCAGETLAIVGESGCGKSVLCKAVCGILPRSGKITAGTVLFQGRDLTRCTETQLCSLRGKEVAMVFQDPMGSLDPTFSVGDQIAEVLRIHNLASKKDAKRQALELLKLVEIPDPEGRCHWYPHQFSGGQRQRIALAIALAGNPQVLIADEPTTALDVTVQAKLIALLRKFCRQQGTAMLLITHDLSVAASLADRIAVMYAGKFVEEGLAQEVLSDPRHPYTWGLLSCLPCADGCDTPSEGIPGSPPDLRFAPKGDAFAPRNPYALEIDFEQEPPMFSVTKTHRAATWLLHPQAPKVAAPIRVQQGKVVRNGGALDDR